MEKDNVFCYLRFFYASIFGFEIIIFCSIGKLYFESNLEELARLIRSRIPNGDIHQKVFNTVSIRGVGNKNGRRKNGGN